MSFTLGVNTLLVCLIVVIAAPQIRLMSSIDRELAVCMAARQMAAEASVAGLRPFIEFTFCALKRTCSASLRTVRGKLSLLQNRVFIKIERSKIQNLKFRCLNNREWNLTIRSVGLVVVQLLLSICLLRVLNQRPISFLDELLTAHISLNVRGTDSLLHAFMQDAKIQSL